MPELPINQAYDVRVKTFHDLTGGTAAKVQYIKPDTTTGEWDATIDKRDLIASVTGINIAGTWQFRAKVTINGSPVYGQWTSKISR